MSFLFSRFNKLLFWLAFASPIDIQLGSEINHHFYNELISSRLVLGRLRFSFRCCKCCLRRILNHAATSVTNTKKINQQPKKIIISNILLPLS